MKSDLYKLNALSVQIHGYPVGVINRLAGDKYVFSLVEEYINDPKRPTLSLSLKSQDNNLITSLRAYRSRLPPFFANVLPEGHLRTYLAQRANVKPEHEFFLLATLGADLPGALTVTPLEMNLPIAENPAGHDNDFKEAILRFSLAGIQLKFSAILESSGGLTIPANGIGGSWIVKLPSNRFALVPENEFVMLALAREIGITIPANHLMNINDISGLPEDVIQMKGKVLAIERFDRSKNGKRIHMEDFAQVFGLFPNNKYDARSYANIAAVLWAETGETGTYEFIQRLIFSVLIGNADMHLKNWSLLYPDKQTPTLSPAYDFVSTLPYIPNDQLALNFGSSRSLSEIRPEQIRRFADTARLSVNPITQLVMETIERTVNAWKKLDEKMLLPNEMKQKIDKQIQTVATNTQRLFRK